MTNKKYKTDSHLEGSIASTLMMGGCEGQDIDECLLWAFGPNAWYVPIWPDWYDRWHKLHPEFPADKKMPFVEWMIVVGNLYARHKKIQEEDKKKFGNLN